VCSSSQDDEIDEDVRDESTAFHHCDDEDGDDLSTETSSPAAEPQIIHQAS